MALTMTQIKEICDYVAEQSNSPDTYNSESNPMRLYYITVTEQGAKVYKKDDDIVAIFGKRNVPYTEGTEVESYISSIIYDNTIPVNGLESVYWKGIGANLSVKTLIRNIGVFLGVKISSNIDKENPVMYDEMVSICRSHIDDINKIPYYICKTSETTYHTYVPLDILVDMAIYLNESGLFNVSNEIYNNGVLLDYGIIDTNSYNLVKDVIIPTRELYNVYDKDKFYEKLKNFYQYGTSISHIDEFFNTLIPAFKNTFDSQINYNNILIITLRLVSSNQISILCNEFNSDTLYIENVNIDNVTTSNQYIYFYDIEKNFTRKSYVLNYDLTTYEFTQSYNVYEYNKDTYYRLSLGRRYSNINFNKVYKIYTYGYSNSNLLEEFTNVLNINTLYTRDQIKTIPFDYINIATNSGYWYQQAISILKNNIKNLVNNNDIIFIFYLNNRVYCLDIKSPTDIKFVSSYANIFASNYYHDTISVLRTRQTGSSTPDPIICKYTEIGGRNERFNNSKIEFTNNTLIDVFMINPNNNNFYQLDTIETNSLTLSPSNIDSSISDNTLPIRLYFSNLGEIVEYKESEEYSGFSLISGSTYPTSVIDEATFRQTYNRRSYVDIHQPVLVDDIVQADEISTTTWVNCSVSKTPPASQSDSEDWNIDDATPEDQEKIADDVDSSANDEDEDDDGIEPNEETLNDEGTNDNELDAEDMANALAFSFLKQYNMSEAQLQDFASVIFNQSGSFFGQIKNLFTNPIEGILSLQIAPELLVPLDSKVEGMKINGVDVTDGVIAQLAVPRLNTNIHKFDIGTLHVPKVFNTYQDITESKLKIYLPFIGYIDLDLALFLDKDIKLSCVVDSLSGSIVYYIYSVDGNEQRLIEQPSGLCYEQIPLNGDATQTFLLGLITGGKNG